jgi:uncharacterized membrane protein
MGFFAKFGDLVIRLFSFLGTIILAIPKIPDKLRNMNTGNIRDKIDRENLKDNISRIREDIGVEERLKNVSKTSTESKGETLKTPTEPSQKSGKPAESHDSDIIFVSGRFSSEEKERTILQLQILSAAFLVFSILHIFNFLSLILYILIAGVTAAYTIYLLFSRVKIMYSQDFSAYRDFFLMYLALGFILVLVSGNPNLVMTFSFQFLPSLSILVFAVIGVAAIFLIFRIRYYRNYTYGMVMEAGKNTAHVKVEYDIRSNVKPDIYLVENSYGAVEGDTVKLKIDEKLLSTGGNKPTSIIETVEKVSLN